MRADRSEVLISDPVKQGEERQASTGPRMAAEAENGLTLEEFAGMVESARAGETAPRTRNQE